MSDPLRHPSTLRSHAVSDDSFSGVVATETELRELYRKPSNIVSQKVLDHLDQHARAFIDAAPFVLVGTASPDGTSDVSPKGGPPGFVVVLDDQRLAIPDLSGNNLLDSITNIVQGSGIGLLFLVPGVDETLRVNGYACITTDPSVLDACAVKDRRPKAAIGVTITQQYMHCAKAFRRSELWSPATWPDRASLPTLGCIIRDQVPLPADLTTEALDELLEADYAKTLVGTAAATARSAPNARARPRVSSQALRTRSRRDRRRGCRTGARRRRAVPARSRGASRRSARRADTAEPCATPPPSLTSLPAAASKARSSAASMPSVTKWNVVPPCIAIGSRGWWVSTKTGWWYGGSSPHQPFQSESRHAPRIGPNMLRPITVAPIPASPSAANRSSSPSSPPSMPSIRRYVRV